MTRLPHPRRRLLAATVLISVAAGATWLWLQPARGTALLTASGTIEVDEVTVAAEVSGRISSLEVDEGASVQPGQLLGSLTDPVLETQARQSVIDPAQHQVMQAQTARLRLLAPIGGVVQKRLMKPGEVVAPGTPILTVADPHDLQLTLYVPEADLGRVALGQAVSIRADAFPDRAFAGRVQSIATRAEFTPRNIQTQKDRQNLVFAVKVRVPNPDGALKAGLPADATFGEP
jgi:HlyD family secretion protein